MNPSSFISAGRTSFSYRSFSRAAMRALLAFGRPLRVPGDACSPAVSRLLRGLRAFSPLGLLLRAELARDLLAADGLAASPTTITFEMAMVPSFSMMPPSRVGLAAALLQVALHGHELLDPDAALLAEDLEDLAALALLLAGDDHDGVALADARPWLQDLRRERDDLHELAGAELAGDRPEDAGADRLEVLVDEDRASCRRTGCSCRPAASPRGSSARSTARATSPFFTLACGIASFTETTMTSPIEAYRRRDAAEHLDALHPLGAAVVGDVEDRLHLDHGLDLRRLLEGLGDAPALVLRHRAGLDDPDLVADLALVVLVVRLVLLGLASRSCRTSGRRRGARP